MNAPHTYDDQYNTWHKFYADRWAGAAARRLEGAEEDIVGVLRHYKVGEPGRAKLEAELDVVRQLLGVKL